MIHIQHRVNRIDELDCLAPGLGAEIDLRSRGNEVILAHDAFSDGYRLGPWLDAWVAGPRRGTLVLNPKEDGLEDLVLGALDERGILDFFLLDLALPTLIRLAVRGSETRIAWRVSRYEPPEPALAMAGRVDWVWLDCFDGRPPSADVISSLTACFRVCLVSPELQGYPSDRIDEFLPLSGSVDAVCTKHPERWGFPDTI